MSYARFSEDSSVYVFGNTAGYFECCACCLGDNTPVQVKTVDDMLDHLAEHTARRHKVPPEAVGWLRHDEAEGIDAHMADIRRNGSPADV